MRNTRKGSQKRRLGNLRYRALLDESGEAGEGALAAEDFDQVVEAGADGAAGAGQAQGMDEGADFDGEVGGDFLDGGAKGVGTEVGLIFEGGAEGFDEAAVFGGEVFAGVGFDFELVEEIEIGEDFDIGELLHFSLMV